MYTRSSSSLAMAKSSSTRSSIKRRPELSMVNIRSKLAGIISHHQQMKLSFHQLKSQIQSGLLEAEDVFTSLSIPLMKLVGLKTDEMAEEGRFSTFVTEKAKCVDATMTEKSLYKEDAYVSKATIAGKELIQKQKLQMAQLIRLLKQIETYVNSSHSDIFQTISNHRYSTQILFQKMMRFLASVHQAGPRTNHDTLVTIVKLLRAAFERVNLAFDSIEGGVDNLIYNLGEKMCTPMMEYVKSLKAEMAAGNFLQLLSTVEKMGGELRNRQLKLEQERSKVSEAEERRVEALCMLKKSEESIQKMKENLSAIIAARSECMEYCAPHKLKGMDHDQATDEGILWELLNKKRKYQKSDSPLGPQELNKIGFNDYNQKSKKVRPQITSRPITRSYSSGLTQKKPYSNSRLLLGSSPSVVPQKVLSCKRITP